MTKTLDLTSMPGVVLAGFRHRRVSNLTPSCRAAPTCGPDELALSIHMLTECDHKRDRMHWSRHSQALFGLIVHRP